MHTFACIPFHLAKNKQQARKKYERNERGESKGERAKIM